MIKKLQSIFSLLILAVLLQSFSPVQAGNEIDEAVRRSLEQLRAQNGPRLSGDDPFEVASAQIVNLADLSYVAYRVKILDNSIGRVYTFWYDANLVLTTEEQAFATRSEAYQHRYGKLSRELYQMVASISITAVGDIPVAIWANQSPADESAVVGPSFPQKIYLPSVRKAGPIDEVLSFLQSHGYTPDYISDQAPVVYATLPPILINELQAQSYVAAIYPQAFSYQTMASAARTVAAPWTWSRGYTGSGIRVAVLEDDGVAFDNPYLEGSKYYDVNNKRIGFHATNVAGVIASTHPTERGIAYGAEILSANAKSGSESSLIAAADWAIKENTNIINASIGTSCQDQNIISLDKYFDWVVWNKHKTVVVSAGNLLDNSNGEQYCPDNHNVSSPGKGYNVITVGSKDDQNTAQTEGDVKDDVFSEFSQYVDPVTASWDRLKPEVTAPGERIITTSESDPWIRSTPTQGTSFAAPIVSGQAALMMQRSSWLKDWPEAVKAGIMATARWTKLHDDQNYSQMASVEKMGVGSVDVTAADNSLINNRIRALPLKKTDLTDGYYYDVPMSGCLSGERMRVVITWPSHPSRLIGNWILNDRLESDFDLLVISPSYQMYLSSADEANYEIVELIMPEAGAYTARIMMMRWDNSSVTERIGFSYYCGSPLD